MTTDSTHRKLRFLAGFAVYFGALWLLWGTPIVYPLKIFVGTGRASPSFTVGSRASGPPTRA